ncbi:MAG: Dph6-related ATP pyrophosphatase, partial [Candidatus Bathyarchaeia archaeon]
MKAVALFSGGKDSLYALHLAEKQGVTVDNLITLLPTLPWPSPHSENIEALKLLAESMGKNLTVVDFKREGAFIEALQSLEVDALVAGDINVKAHLVGLQDVCGKTGLKLLEPIYGRDTSEL